MDMIYYQRPIFLLFPILLLSWQILIYLFNKKKQVSPLANTLMTGVGVVGHAVVISVILLSDGTLSDALVLVLLSGILSLFLSPNPNKTSKRQEEDKN